MKYRNLGRTGLEVSVIAFGGIMLNNTKQCKADKIVAEAIEKGVNLFDVGPTYGNAQNILGPALEPYRDNVVLTCKTEPDKSKEEVKEDIKKSLELLKTDYFDVYQLHEVTDYSAVGKALAPGGPLEAIKEAKDEGLIKNIGFSAHSEWAAIHLMKAFDFDTVMFPINWNYWYNEKQGKTVIEKAKETDKGIMAIKALAHRQWNDGENRNDFDTWYKPLYDNKELAELALKFTLSQDVDTAVSPGSLRMFKKALNIIENNENFLELTESELNKLKDYAENDSGRLYPIPGDE
ncbi:MAG TPA: aldo/keto reductase [Halanaerobiales bacterium]|nr:aldo/keto reductase [Halanaerobiales bacterium]